MGTISNLAHDQTTGHASINVRDLTISRDKDQNIKDLNVSVLYNGVETALKYEERNLSYYKEFNTQIVAGDEFEI